MNCPGGGGRVDAEDVQQVVRVEAEKADNRKKLGDSGAESRHLFVYVVFLNYLPEIALRKNVLPKEGPSLPEEVTQVWAVAATGVKDQFIVWTAERGGDWSSLGAISCAVASD